MKLLIKLLRTLIDHVKIYIPAYNHGDTRFAFDFVKLPEQ